MLSSTQAAAALPPGAAATTPVFGELRLQLFLSLATPWVGAVRVRLRFNGASGLAAGESAATLEPFAGGVLAFPLRADARAVLASLAACRTATLQFTVDGTPLGAATVDCDGFAPGAPAAARYPLFAPGGAPGGPLGHVDVAWRMHLWADATSGHAAAPGRAAAAAAGLGGGVTTRNLAPKLAVPKPPPAAARHANDFVAPPRRPKSGTKAAGRPVVAETEAQEEEAAAAATAAAGVAQHTAETATAASTSRLNKLANMFRARTGAGGADSDSEQKTVPTQADALPQTTDSRQQPQPPRPPPPPPPPPVQPKGGPPRPSFGAALPQPAPPHRASLAAGPAGLLSVVAAPFTGLAAALDDLAGAAAAGDAASQRDARRQSATLALAASVVINPNAASAWALGVPADWAVQLRPARYAFALWPVLYGGLVLYALFQARASQRGSPLLRRVGWPAAGALAALSLWAALACVEATERGMPPSYAAKLGRAAVAASAAAGLLATLALLLRCLAVLADHAAPFSLREHLFVVAPLSALAGWLVPLATGNMLTAATAALALVGLRPPPAAGVTAAAAVGITGIGATLATLRAKGNPYFSAALAWGLWALARNNTAAGVRAAALRDPGAPLKPDRDVVFAAMVMAGIVAGASVVRIAFAPKRKWGPRGGIAGALDACCRNARALLDA